MKTLRPFEPMIGESLDAPRTRRSFLAGGAAIGLAAATSSLPWSGVRAATPSKGGHLRAGADGGSSTDSFTPLQALGADHPTLAILSTFDTLTEIDHLGEPQPSLAESWEGSPDGTWAFKLRKDVEFHDGKSLTSEDVVWSLQQHLREDNKFAEGKQIVENFSELRADGADTVVIKQKEVNFDLPVHLSAFGLIIGQAGKEGWDDGIGTGPYVLESFEPGVRYMGRKFANFYRNDEGFFEEVEVLNVADAASRVSGLLSGSFDAIGSPDFGTAQRLAAAPNTELVQVQGFQHFTTDMRTDVDPYTNNELRLAVKYGIKRQEIVDKVLGGYGTVGNDLPVSRNVRYYNDSLPQREYDPDKAKYHLRKAGYEEIDLTFSTSDGAFDGAVDIGLLMQQSMAPIGMNVTVDRRPADGYWSDVWLKEPWCAVYWNGRPTIDWMLSSTYTAASPWNSTYFDNPEFERLLEAARSEADDDERRRMYHEAQRILWEEGGVVVLAFANILIGHSDRLGHGPVGVSRRMDDSRLPRRWWFAS